jgi:hypothetical protein
MCILFMIVRFSPHLYCKLEIYVLVDKKPNFGEDKFHGLSSYYHSLTFDRPISRRTDTLTHSLNLEKNRGHKLYYIILVKSPCLSSKVGGHLFVCVCVVFFKKIIYPPHTYIGYIVYRSIDNKCGA